MHVYASDNLIHPQGVVRVWAEGRALAELLGAPAAVLAGAPNAAAGSVSLSPRRLATAS